jgi:Family of unknown function (DUF6527)
VKAQPLKIVNGQYIECDKAEACFIKIKIPNVPSVIKSRILPVKNQTSTQLPQWDWNQDTERPTLSPSVRTVWEGGDGKTIVCHSFIKDGMIEFLNDSTHSSAGVKDRTVNIQTY